ncbi:MAG: uracil-DNA glycosylase [Planctomycetes bacterium]|nr:uracil-DNA glycosylase [Planctomycetota bacterium]
MPRTNASTREAELHAHAERLCDCKKCPRLAAYVSGFAKDPEYWAKPVPGFGDPAARLLVLGLAPGAHGANRTGRPFTGDGAGVLLYQALHDLGLATRADAINRNDGLELRGVWITNAVRCVPPANKPTPLEERTCSPWLTLELTHLSEVRAVVALGRTAHDAALRLAGEREPLRSRDFPFAHAAEHSLPRFPRLYDCFHTSRYNVNTRRVNQAMVNAVFQRAATAAGLLNPSL